MRLAIIRRRYNPYGGAERFIERLIPILAERGIETSVISDSWRIDKSMKNRFIQVKSTGWTRSAKFKSFENNVRLFLENQKLHSKRFDLIQSHERLVGANIFRAGDGVHRAWLERMQKETGFFRSRWLNHDPYHSAVIETERKMAADKALHYIANSQMIFDELQEYLGISSDRISLIYNGVNTARFVPASAEQKRESRKKMSKLTGMNFSSECKIISFLGSGFNRKGVPQLIDAAERMKDVFTLICGEDREAERSKRRIIRRGMKARVALTGPLEDVRPLLWAADVFVLPSLYDPSSNAVLEALACGLPVIVTRDVGMADEIISAEAGLVCSRQVDSISDALTRALTPALNTKMSHNAREMALRFDHERVVEAWLEIYRKFVAQNT